MDRKTSDSRGTKQIRQIGDVFEKSKGRQTNMAVLRLGNADVTPAIVDGPSCVFTASPFLMTKKAWVPDSDVTICPLCHQKFTQIRRKHHCRQCGRILCGKCCENKLLLPQLNYDHEPQKVCNECLPVSQLVAKSRSPQFSKKEEAAKLLNEMCKDINQLQKLVELGGVQTLIFLSQSINNSIKWQTVSSEENVAEALHMMATHTVLHPLLVQSGAIKALCSLLSDSESFERILIDALSAMMIFCKNENYRKQVVVEGALKPILTLCGMKETIALLATTTLSLLVDNEDNLYTVVDKEKEALWKIMNLVNAKDEKMQEIALKILASLSLGTEWHRHRIVQEHYSNGKCLVNVFRTVPSNQQVLVNGICLLGNLATSEKDQSVLRECLECVCALMRKNEVNVDVQVQISRCIANFSKHKVNTATLLEYIPEIVRLHVQVEDATTRLYGVKTLFNLLNIEQGHVLSLLSKPQLDTLLHSLLNCSGMHDSLLTCLEKSAPPRSRPMTL